MNDFDKILWGFIFSICGVIFGWSLNQLGQWFNTKAENKKNLKIVLFNLLQTYDLFYSYNFDEIFDKIIQSISNEIPQQERKEFDEMIYQILPSILKEQSNPEQKEEILKVKENYSKSIQTLSSIDPLTAYYLNSNKNIPQILDKIEKSFSYFEKEFPISKIELNDIRNKLLNEISPNMRDMAVKEFEKDIKLIAWKINPIMWLNSKKTIRRLREDSEKNIDIEIENITAQIMKFIEEQENEEITTTNCTQA